MSFRVVRTIAVSVAVCASSLVATATATATSSATAIDMCPAERAGPLVIQPEFGDASNACCYQAGGNARSSCGDLDYCFGVSVSHPLSNHPGCCDDDESTFPSCVAFRRLRSDLDDLRAASAADAVVSVIVLCLSLVDAFLFVTQRTRPAKMLCAVLVLEVVDLCLCLAMVGILKRNDAIGTALSLLRASCFNDVGNEANIALVYDELENIFVLAIIEALVCLVAMGSHGSCLYLKLNEDVATKTKETLAATFAVATDFAECVMGVVGLAVFLLPTLRSFDALYQTLGAGDSAVTAPCVRSCCVVDALLPFHGTSSPTALSSSSPSVVVVAKDPTSSPTLPPSASPSSDAYSYADLQRSVLEAFYDATDGPRWEVDRLNDRRTNWTTADTNPCAWHGVACDVNTGRVVEIDLFGLGKSLRGSLPTELGRLASLRTVNLHGHDLSATSGSSNGLPSELANLPHLEDFQITNSRLRGTIPPSFGDDGSLSRLRVLDLRWNDLSSGLPDALGGLVALEELRLRYNGRLRFGVPSALANATRLRVLDLYATAVTGTLPAEATEGWTELEELYLGSRMEGPLPAALARFASSGSGRRTIFVPDSFGDDDVPPATFCANDDGNGTTTTTESLVVCQDGDGPLCTCCRRC